MLVSLKPAPPRVMTSVTSHSRKATLPPSRSKTSSSKRRVKMLSTNCLLLVMLVQLMLRVAQRVRLKPHPNQLLRLVRRELPRNQKHPLMLERVLTRSLSTLQTSQAAEKKPHKRVNLPQLLVNHLPREPPLVPRRPSQLHHHHQERNQPRPPIK